jgi:hypothetical protein
MLFQDEIATGKAIYTYTKGLLSMDPFLTMRLLRELDLEADEAWGPPSNGFELDTDMETSIKLTTQNQPVRL